MQVQYLNSDWLEFAYTDDFCKILDENNVLNELFAWCLLQRAKNEIDELNSDLRELEKTRLQLAQFFCEEEKTFKLDECIRTFYDFFEKFKKAIQVSLQIKPCNINFTVCNENISLVASWRYHGQFYELHKAQFSYNWLRNIITLSLTPLSSAHNRCFTWCTAEVSRHGRNKIDFIIGL